MSPRIVAANLVMRLITVNRQPSAIFFTLAFPVILVLVFGTIFAKPERLRFALPVQDLDGSEASERFVGELTGGGEFSSVAVPSEVDAARYAREHRLNLVLVIPRGFEEATRRRIARIDPEADVVLTYVHDPSSTSVNTKVQILHSIVAEANQRMSGTTPFLTLSAQSILDRTYRFIEFFVPGIIAMAVMTSCLSGALSMNAELRQRGILRKLATTPITSAEWLLSSILYQLVLAIASTGAILLVSRLVFDVRLRIDGWLPAFIVLAVFVFVGIGMLLTPIAKEAESASAAANAFLFPMMFLSGTFFPVEMMPGFLQSFARILPLYYVNEGLRASMIFIDHAEALRCLAITGVVAATVFAAGSFVTRWKRDG